MLVINNIEVRYSRSILVLKGVSLQVDKESIVVLLGANGAGKTTTLRAISGLLDSQDGEISEGFIEFEGKRIEKASAEKIVKMGITQIMEERRIFENLTTEENLKVGGHTRKGRASMNEEMEKVYGYFPGLKHLQKKISGYLSGGEQQMMVVGRGMMAQPKLMLLDEPSLGLAPLVVKEIFGILHQLHDREKKSILLVEQNAKAALDIADYAYVMENGRIVLDGPASKLKDNEDIKEFYLGLSGVGQKKSYREVKHYKRRKRWLA
ncbi:MAG: ABC transporter ATP-binding protein [Thermodesulfobacteriota bacterium]|nr:ABC transporter ATP-binding protein [Thermodesulfobacteriota bacterium]